MPQFIGENIIPPIYLSPEQDDLCNRIDEWYKPYGLKIRPSDMFRGAMFALREECSSNPDCIAQAAHSLREILYPFISKHIKTIPDKPMEAFKKFGSAIDGNFYNKNIFPLAGRLTDIAHHGIDPKQDRGFDFSSFQKDDLRKLVNEFEKNMNTALSKQLDIHKAIDAILAGGSN